MKKIIVALIALAALVVALVAPSGQTNADFLRIHIRADSNSAADQNVKYAVKTAVVDYLTPYLVDIHSKEDAMKAVKARLSGIEEVADEVLAANGFAYKSTAKLTAEQFPDRTYGDVTLAEGVYDALIIELGSGKGDNWWCVVYPPLCFVGGENNGSDKIIYKSKLAEIIRQWRAAHSN